MSTKKRQLEEFRTIAMKAKIHPRGDEADGHASLNLDVARALLAAFAEAEMAGKSRKDLSESEEISLLQREAKKRRSSAEIYATAGAQERAARESAEAEIVESFLPKAPTELELQHFIADYVGANGLAGAGKSAMGEVMRVLREEFINFDGKIASQLAAKILA